MECTVDRYRSTQEVEKYYAKSKVRDYLSAATPSEFLTPPLGLLLSASFHRPFSTLLDSRVYFRDYMDHLLHEHYRLRDELQAIETENEKRALLLNLSVLWQHSMGSTATQTDAPIEHKDSSKLRDYEIKLSMLQLQLSTKEKVHEARVDELKDEISRLKSHLSQSGTSSKKDFPSVFSLKIVSPPSLSGRSVSLNSNFFSPDRSIFNSTSPLFPSSKGSDSLASILALASLKLSQSDGGKAFSPPSSADLTPVRTVHEAEEAPLTKESAESGRPEKPKKKKLRLVSLSNSKHGDEPKLLPEEPDHADTLDMYKDENFEHHSSSPLKPPQLRVTSSEPAVKKRHVFKI